MTFLYDKSVAIREMNKYGLHWFKFDETSGNVIDSKGSAVGTVSGATRTVGWNGEGNAMNFSGNQYVTFNQRVIPLGKKSIRFKIKYSNYSTSKEGNILTTADWINSHGIQFAVGTNGRLYVRSGKGNNNQARFILLSTMSLNDNKWHDVLFTWDGTTNTNCAKLYVDNMNTPNAVATANALETTTQTYNLRLGGNNQSTVDYFFTGELDNLEIYNEVIDPYSNKSLILHDGEYKKVIPAVPYQPEVLSSRVGLVPNMTSYTAPSGLAFASSFQKTGREPWRAFNNNSTTDYSWNTESYKANGEFIGYIFTNPQKISSYAIYPVNVSPSGWDFQISNDTTNGTDGTWKIIDTKRSQAMSQTLNYYDLHINIEAKAFRFVTRPAIGSGNQISSWVRQIQVYKRDIISPEIQAEPFKIESVSTNLPHSTQFLEQGMDNLSPLLNRNITILKPIAMSENSEILDEGEIGTVFSKTINLKKYFDIRSIRTEVR